MAETQNPIKASSRKRPNDSVLAGPSVTKKRAVLGDITNISSRVSGLDVISPKLKAGAASENEPVDVMVEDFVSPGSGDKSKFGYAPLIYQHLHSLEMDVKRRPLSNYMEKVQKDINPGMREVLIDWLVEVAEEYKLVSDTLHLTVSYLDRYLSCHSLNRNKLQLLGVSCMLVASKYEDIHPPRVENFCYITDNTYTSEEIVLMESEILKLLDFNMGSPTAKTFVRIFIKAAQEISSVRNKFEYLCYYLAELSLLDYGCVRYLPSMVAASAIFLSNFTIQPNFHPWSQTLQQHTGYRPYELKECILRLHKLKQKSEAAEYAVRQKYMNHRMKSVAELCSLEEVPAYYFEDPEQ